MLGGWHILDSPGHHTLLPCFYHVSDIRHSTSTELFHVNARDVHRSMSWIFFFLSVVVDNDEIWKSWNFELHSSISYSCRNNQKFRGLPSRMQSNVKDDVERVINLWWNPPTTENSYEGVLFGEEFKSGIKKVSASFSGLVFWGVGVR